MRSLEQSLTPARGASVNRQGKAAHLEVENKYGRDILGLKAPQWEHSIYVNGAALYGHPAHRSLDNHITAGHINQQDFRHLTGPTHRYHQDKDASFTRGDATTGWNLSTTVSQQQLRQQLSNSLASSLKHTQQRFAALKGYSTPAENSTAVASKIKAARNAAAVQLAALQSKYGKEGAAEILRIDQMHPVGIKRQHKANKYDLQAVANLDDHEDLSDSL